MGEKAKTSPKGTELRESITKMKALAPGAKAPEFSLPTPTGEEISLKSLQGNIIILDFWASCFIPQRHEEVSGCTTLSGVCHP